MIFTSKRINRRSLVIYNTCLILFLYLVSFLRDIVLLNLIFFIFYLFIIGVTLSVLVSRLHDFNRTGWWALLIFIPIVNLILFTMLFFVPGNKNKNKYGEVPCKYDIFIAKERERSK